MKKQKGDSEKIFFLTLPAYGHINPSINVVLELQRRGYHVICYALNEFKSLIESTGATYREYHYKKLYDTAISRNVGLLGKTLIDITKDLLPSLLKDASADQPACIVHDATAVWGKILSQETWIPAVSVCCTLAYHDKIILKYPSLFVKTLRKSGIDTFAAIRDHNSLYKEFGFKYAGMKDLFSNKEPLNIVFTSSSYHPCASSFDSSFKFVGPSLSPRKEKDSVSYPRNKKIVYISLGTVINNDKAFYEKLLQAFADTPYAVIISLGKRFSPSDFSFIPKNVQLKTYVNQLDVLQHTDLFITHAGLNGVNEGLYYGVPMILIPDTEEQAVLAHRVQELKAGIVLAKEKVDKKMFLQAVEKIFRTKSYEEYAKKMQKLLQKTGGYKEAADAIISYINSSSKKNISDVSPIS